MGYAIIGNSMRAVDSAEDCVEGETYYDDLPTPWPPISAVNEGLAISARAKRDGLLSDVYDKGVLMAQRAIRLNGDADGKLAAKLHELDQYAVALQNVPKQTGFPQTITWPTAPTDGL